MYDSTNIYDIPTSAQMVGYYVDGLYAYPYATVRKRFPNAVLVGISAIGTDNGVVGDVENGDLTPSESVDWVLARRRAGVDPSLYFSISQLATVQAAFKARGVPMPHVWDAYWTAVPHIDNGAYATQYDHPPHSGGHYDLSKVVAYWPGVG